MGTAPVAPARQGGGLTGVVGAELGAGGGGVSKALTERGEEKDFNVF